MSLDASVRSLVMDIALVLLLLALTHALSILHPAGLPDEVEFLVRNEGVNGRNFSGDEGSGLLVTLRSVAGTVQCALRVRLLALFAVLLGPDVHTRRHTQVVYPFVTPISDGGLQKSRLALIRDQLRWRLVGCELQECYAQ